MEWILFLFFIRQDLPPFAQASARQAGLFGFFYLHHFPEESDET
jgi:hypothetical protein